MFHIFMHFLLMITSYTYFKDSNFRFYKVWKYRRDVFQNPLNLKITFPFRYLIKSLNFFDVVDY